MADWAETKAWELVNNFVAGQTVGNEIVGLGDLAQAIASALREERERCAGVAALIGDEYRLQDQREVGEAIVKAIRETEE